MQGTWLISQRIPGSFFVLTFSRMFLKIPWNVQENSGNVPKDSGEYSKKFQGIFEKSLLKSLLKILGNIQQDSVECY